MVIGGVTCASGFVAKVENDISFTKFLNNGPNVAKWTKVRSNNVHKYENLIDVFFEHNSCHRLDFSAIVVDCRKLNHARYNLNDAEIGFSKFLFQHLKAKLRHYGEFSRFHCRLDQRKTRQSLDNLRQMLNIEARKLHKDSENRFKTIEFRSIDSEPLLQISDLLIGAIGYATNQKSPGGKDLSKPRLAEFIRQSANLPSLATRTGPSERHFNIWHFQGRDWDN